MTDAINLRLRKTWGRIQSHARSWRCRDKILVIESDDWGSIRTFSAEACQELVRRGYAMDRSCWSVDALETDDDLLALYEVLDEFRDKRGRPACLTANMVMANPDFEAIRASEYLEYHYEPVSATLERSPERRRVAALWREGMSKGWFRPQFHAREHVQWRSWLQALRAGSVEALETFDLRMCGVPRAASKEGRSFYQPVYTDTPADVERMVGEGMALFEKQFGFRSLSTIAPNCGWTDAAERAWSANGVRYVQGGYLQLRANGDMPRCHFLGQPFAQGGRYLVRNCVFEPAKVTGEDHWQGCLNEIARAFCRGAPAIVTSHRVNYVGAISEANRARGLEQLRKLLKAVTERWPDVGFLSSPELGIMIEQDLGTAPELDVKESDAFPAVDGESREFVESAGGCGND